MNLNRWYQRTQTLANIGPLKRPDRQFQEFRARRFGRVGWLTEQGNRHADTPLGSVRMHNRKSSH